MVNTGIFALGREGEECMFSHVQVWGCACEKFLLYNILSIFAFMCLKHTPDVLRF